VFAGGFAAPPPCAVLVCANAADDTVIIKVDQIERICFT
jgi:hypothetical protein